ncbi:MAG TPA: sigma-70 family RNA polymerase sigma factor [Algoriphagus sp.]|jgi:RNA polymerase sigma factor (sigma-70 family)|uniref:RNA polymerase sigma factor n=2 Tax=Cyclobacteriaceae TaxID=563798 RepID=UPI000C67FB3F|nr:sigma-70 family RNA polymerase sigma factor [Algoriphagus sp. NBT04N3]MAL14756.1 RNA polymerase subunit sigma-70 [Algoriphagus sp.]MAN86707.1 RNA polymerase subunit sigma-70 [Algoriphagus sp.]QYH38871.1 sigma-70 family RNA polymerase sigma factor [Algoriphagus sp. NBT04N3]HAH38924.1 sigma-70 family RNA polymerase sigma factor [Algoriphagus sp.]HAS57705.1 sigma-70 family RNA polymerase sigma factor [Algoriphagus sp.]|tara:strand:- start:30 stop:638 length:609 start_codon:yes stop_codon:yes gene_type:complete
MKLNPNFTDQELVEMILTKNRQNMAITLLYRQYYGVLENYILQNSGSSDDAADIIQEVMLIFVQMISEGKFRAESSIKSFLYSICRNLWITELRKRKSSAARQEKYEESTEKVDSDVSESIAKTESLKYIMGLFQELGNKCKQILQLFYYEELPMKEICEKLDFSSEQVLRNKKYKCLKSLIEKTQASPQVYQNLQKALRHE